ncbi:PhzF family isomerase [Acinetobacter baumannii]|uniref:PhzF family isomerase n=1 Tax=Acinetobacter baumannii TaxID=470 RepID=UPI0007F89EE5|nr:PhzF family isomerase [Acinetobacter baumannii]MDC5196756.1 PhzF family isomerase [Acinetobacter baumannii]MDH2482180.1 PhzF family isomerase [Acinetobacter baumannii]MDH2503244.1 PhzF family isomerase [Acinetobacter baumannii]MDV7504262.1 PhzF family isomerase [Acinetobacter baumannii]MDV7529100.1 PhzF family isomerase [Acinetobacter baumannii]
MTTIYIVDAFTTKPNTGNRAGVVLDADHLTTQEMQDIAAFAGYSETAFVLSPKDQSHDIHVRYFTPTHEVPICGHATIATHFLRATSGHHSDYPLIAKTGAGHLPVSIFGSSKELLVKMTQGRVEFLPPFNESQRTELASALGVSKSDFADLPIQVVTTGHSKVMVPMLSRSKLDGLTPNNEKLKAISAEIGCNGFFPFVLEGSRQEPITYGRMFAPAIGINEDPVTGNANGPAGAYLVHHDLIECDQKVSYWGYQGFAIEKPGRVLVTVEKTDSILHVSIAGQAVLVGSVLYSGKD